MSKMVRFGSSVITVLFLVYAVAGIVCRWWIADLREWLVDDRDEATRRDEDYLAYERFRDRGY